MNEDLAGFIEVERYRTKVGDSDEMTEVAVRLTTMVRREADATTIVSRHADPITVAGPASR